jgi:Cu-Zn family superoxide dismutase|uniref:superoxide dismutase n=1 Tax=viral metagenome TaxID=1070528 RepID=A0A6C0E2L9_9ZZZZ
MKPKIYFNTSLLFISLLAIFFVIVYYLYKISRNNPIYAIAVFNDRVNGYVKFSEDLTNNMVKIDLHLTGLTPNSLHGFHVHEAGDLSDKCTSMCAHFNPYGNTHGCPGMSKRHVGDLGNIKTNDNGDSIYTFYDNVIKLRGNKCNIIGRGLIIHEDEDDCGKGENAESLKTGNAGKRIACAVIGYSKENYT